MAVPSDLANESEAQENKSENNQWKQHPTHLHWNKEASKA